MTEPLRTRGAHWGHPSAGLSGIGVLDSRVWACRTPHSTPREGLFTMSKNVRSAPSVAEVRKGVKTLMGE